ncbi:3-deoxy-D-manno-octulosonic acid transferase [Aureitalea marina]|uniref:3-deoxy-D-manno-octulosonic acid transferase n=1 Tax=Aureitalea marina TaxID=930804 RepID=UPI003182BCBD
MRLLYNFLTYLTVPILWLAGVFSPKMGEFMRGRKGVFQKLENGLAPNKKTIWFHCASLGEFEQGVPIMEALRKELPNYQILVTFFSPSGFTIKKDTPSQMP